MVSKPLKRALKAFKNQNENQKKSLSGCLFIKKKYEGFASGNSQADLVGPAVRVGVTPALITNIIILYFIAYK